MIRPRRYTDLAVVLSATRRSSLEDLDDILRNRPEILLGYNVQPLSVAGVMQGYHRGLRVEKLVVCSYVMTEQNWMRAVDEVYFSQVGAHFPKTEWYHVHRGEDPVISEGNPWFV